MAKARLLQAVCAVALLAAAPAFAQRPEAGMTGPNGAPNPAAQQPAPSSGGDSSMAPAANPGGTGASASTDSQSTHRSAMAHPTRAMRGQTDASQDAAVDRLNDQSYQAAQQGQPFSGPTGGSGGMSDMSGGTPGASGAGGSKDDTGAK